MLWRGLAASAYAALAVVVGIADGARGLLILLGFYGWAVAWVVALLVWGGAARTAGRWNARRLDAPPPEEASGGSGEPGAGEAVLRAPAADGVRSAGAARKPLPVL